MKIVVQGLAVFFVCSWLVGVHAFIAHGTQVSVGSKPVSIQSLDVGSMVSTYDPGTGAISSAIIWQMSSHATDTIYRVAATNGQRQVVFEVSGDQLLYDRLLVKCVPAAALTTANVLCDAQGAAWYCLSVAVHKLDVPIEMYAISIDAPHLFLITDVQLVAHNFIDAASVSVAVLWGAGWTAKVSASVVIGGLTWGFNRMFGTKQKRKAKRSKMQKVQEALASAAVSAFVQAAVAAKEAKQ